jgi:hypothetical protein
MNSASLMPRDYACVQASRLLCRHVILSTIFLVDNVKCTIIFSLLNITEFRGRVVNILFPYSGCPGFKSRPGDRLYSLRFSWLSSVPPSECLYSTLKLGHDLSLPNQVQFIIHLSRFRLTLYNLSYLKMDH